MDFGHDRASIDGRILGGRLLQIKRLPERGHIIEFILVDQCVFTRNFEQESVRPLKDNEGYVR